ncbi:conserved hypothetical protein [Rhodopseudomonas palustris TIE-1]|uniref:hypothetical protein n=1 Tax=Rhodopseudomonas palustris TaxID=1076 RepID=UPI000164B408|nr:hypothetical protein [Rhodopseudomonas palustris]ACF02593.1 conserved hypothetical protein [Rhodopseudomonas palustris TIE-1]
MTEDHNLTTTPEQLNLNLHIAVESEVDGILMGVLSDGTPYLHIRSLARMCGVDHSMIVRITGDWMLNPLRPREAAIRELVKAQGADDKIAFIAVDIGGTIHHIIPDAVCMAILEYYAFDARSSNDQALKAYRTLARKGFREFIYAQVGYNPTGAPDIAWQQFHDRVALSYHTVPDGYFSIFKEISDLFVTMIRQGVNLGSSFVPDISVGIAWSKYWQKESLDIIHGERKKYIHNYPNYFPQAASNPQLPFCYPDDALGEFRKWFREHYMQKQLPEYLMKKVKDGALTPSTATAAVAAFKPTKVLPAPSA